MYSYISCVISWLAFIAGIAALLYFYSNYNKLDNQKKQSIGLPNIDLGKKTPVFFIFLFIIVSKFLGYDDSLSFEPDFCLTALIYILFYSLLIFAAFFYILPLSKKIGNIKSSELIYGYWGVLFSISLLLSIKFVNFSNSFLYFGGELKKEVVKITDKRKIHKNMGFDEYEISFTPELSIGLNTMKVFSYFTYRDLNRGDTVTIKFKKGRYGIHFLYSGPEKVKTSNSNKKY